MANGSFGMEKDVLRAAELYQRASDGFAQNMLFNCARLLAEGAGSTGDTKRGAQVYERAAEEVGDVRAMNDLAVLRRDGADGVDPRSPRRRDSRLKTDLLIYSECFIFIYFCRANITARSRI